MRKRTFLDAYCRYLAAWYLRFFRKRYAAEYAYVRSCLEQSRARTMYLFGITVLRVCEYGRNRIVLLFGRFPTLLISDAGTKTCVYLGRAELWKIRRSGTLQLPENPVLMEARSGGRRRLFYDLGPFEKSSAGAGVPRVAGNLLAALLKERDCPYEVVPVRSGENMPGFFRAFDRVRETFPFLNVGGGDGIVRFSAGDVLLYPIPDLGEVETQYQVLKFLKERGVRICFIVHDIIVMRHPEFFDASLHENMGRWLRYVSEFSGILAVSRASEQEFLRWRREHAADGNEDFFTSWFHLGSDVCTPVSSRGLPESCEGLLRKLKRSITFLEVSTIEPRKGYEQALDAFEKLWKKGVDVNFVIVGRKGWKMDAFLKRLESHVERGRRLFWLNGISDEFLDRIYDVSSAVLMPSEAEGFGLAVVEGAGHGKPLILRDLPVFREIAGSHATYFSGRDPEALSGCLEQWLQNYERGTLPSSGDIRILSWEESARMLLSGLHDMEARTGTH